jgi:hypothetical protein
VRAKLASVVVAGGAGDSVGVEVAVDRKLGAAVAVLDGVGVAWAVPEVHATIATAITTSKVRT